MRRFGWTLDDSSFRTGRVCLFDAAGMDSAAMMCALVGISEAERAMAIVLGVTASSQRAVLVGMGFAEVLGDDVTLEELAVRAKRLVARSAYLPRFRTFDRLRIDLLGRDAYFNGRPLDLNPREFTLLWRLSDSPDVTVSKPDLIRDVWNMGFIPETNSIAVHMSRLRRKLSDVGLPRIIETCNTGGYRLCVRDLALGHGATLYAVPDPVPPSPGVRKTNAGITPPTTP
ncbi:winged helix-turn-helix domain-containing protein [Novosphingobium colocasiae]|uniref:winged helix-turn-helix domain-containing protein n=1 Tax=Novosphingobium colocasiae TaxID=1256513 RepID=UPI0035B0F291